MAITIEGLTPTAIPSVDHQIPAMKDGLTVKLTVGQIVGLAPDPASLINAAPAKASLADADLIGAVDTADLNKLKKTTLSQLISSIFKTTRKIANAYFLSSFRLWDAADNTKGLAFNLAAVATATTRVITVPNADVDLSIVGKFSVSGNPPAYGCRAWINFDGTPGTPNIRGSGNVASITDNGTGDYTINFNTAMPNANYGVAIAHAPTLGGSTAPSRLVYVHTLAAGSVRVLCVNNAGAATDFEFVSIQVFC